MQALFYHTINISVQNAYLLPLLKGTMFLLLGCLDVLYSVTELGEPAHPQDMGSWRTLDMSMLGSEVRARAAHLPEPPSQ